jgi:voltage-gated potassium channel
VVRSATMHDLRMSVYRLLESRVKDTPAENATNRFLVLLILLNVLAVILESIAPMRNRFGRAFGLLETTSVAIFSVEYALRVWSCTANPSYSHPVWGRLRFMLSPAALVDLAAVTPAYLPGDVLLDLRFARALRLIRMSRVLKMGRYSSTLQTFGRVFKARRTDLVLIVLFLLVLLVVSSSSMYFIEHPAQPEVFSSIPAAMWWATATLTTVGYGDIYPITPAGKFVGSLIALLGIGFFALPAGILAAAFADELRTLKAAPAVCPHCGREPSA